MANLTLEALFDLERFRDDVDAYCKRNEVSRTDLARITGLGVNTIGNVWQKGVVSLVTAIALSVVADLSLDSYMRDDFLEDDVIVATPAGRHEKASPGSRERDRLANRAKQRATKKLIDRYRSEFEALVDVERAALGLPPVNRAIPGREAIAAAAEEKSGVEWIDEEDMAFSDRTEWAYPGQRQLAIETGVSLEEVVARESRVDEPV